MHKAEISAKGSSPSKTLLFVGLLWLLAGVALYVYDPAIMIEWETATEVDTAGFNIYRSSSPDGEFSLLTTDLIPAQGSAVSGASYSYSDRTFEPGKTYYYLLEEIEFSSAANREEDVFSSTAPQTWWITVLSGASIFLGLIVLFIGVREGKRNGN